MQNKRIRRITLILITVVLLSVISFLNSRETLAERNWDRGDQGKIKQENQKWEDEIDRWNENIKQWSKRRDDLHKKYFKDKYDRYAEYCQENGVCYKESMFKLIKIINNKEKNFDKDECDVKITFANGDGWKCALGQTIKFAGAGGEYWESSNFGQSLEFKDRQGNEWESSNFGQVIKFNRVSGEHWESINFGGRVIYTDSNGQTWEGNDGDTVDDMRWRNN